MAFLNGTVNETTNGTVNGAMNGEQLPPASSAPLTNGYHHDTELEAIAIIGMSCRTPGNVKSAEDLWELCSQGRSGWSEVPPSRFNHASFYHPNPGKIGCVSDVHPGSGPINISSDTHQGRPLLAGRHRSIR